MASREELLESIHSNMKLSNALFLKIYGYEISFPGFADKAIKKLNDAGCSRAREYYDKAVSEYERKHDREIKEIAAWYRKKGEEEWRKKQAKRGELRRKQKKQARSERWTELSRILDFR